MHVTFRPWTRSHLGLGLYLNWAYGPILIRLGARSRLGSGLDLTWARGSILLGLRAQSHLDPGLGLNWAPGPIEIVARGWMSFGSGARSHLGLENLIWARSPIAFGARVQSLLGLGTGPGAQTQLGSGPKLIWARDPNLIRPRARC